MNLFSCFIFAKKIFQTYFQINMKMKRTYYIGPLLFPRTKIRRVQNLRFGEKFIKL